MSRRSANSPRTRTPNTGGRTCLVCRACRPPTELVRLGWSERLYLGRGPGRGAWVCVTARCLSRLNGRSLARAWRRESPLADRGLGEQIGALAQARAEVSAAMTRRNPTVASEAAYWSALWYETDTARRKSAGGAWPSGGHDVNDDEVA